MERARQAASLCECERWAHGRAGRNERKAKPQGERAGLRRDGGAPVQGCQELLLSRHHREIYATHWTIRRLLRSGPPGPPAGGAGGAGGAGPGRGCSSFRRRNRRSSPTAGRARSRSGCGCCGWRWRARPGARLTSRKSSAAACPTPLIRCAITPGRFPEAQRFYLIGADHLSQLPKWRAAEELARLVEFVVIPRPGQGGGGRFLRHFVGGGWRAFRWAFPPPRSGRG